MGGPERDVWGYITTYRTVQSLQHPVGHPLTTQTLEMGTVHTQEGGKNYPKLGYHVHI